LSQSSKALRAGIAFERGERQEAAGAFDAAASEYRIVTDTFPDSTLVLARLGISLKKAGRVSEAQAILERLAGRKGSDELVQEVNKTIDDVSKERDALSQQIEQKKASVAELESRLQDLGHHITTAEEQLRSLKTSITQMEDNAKNGVEVDRQEYDRLIAQHNSIVERHNADIETRRTLYAQYQSALNQVNALIDKYNRLVKPKTP